MPIIDTKDARDLDSHLQSFFDSTPAERPHRLRQLFTEKFDFNSATGKINLAKAPQNVSLPSDAERIASTEGINVVYVPLQIPGTTRVRKAEAVASAKLVANQLGDDMLLLMTNEQAGDGASQLHIILPTFVGSTPALRRMVIERDLPRRTTLQQLSNIYHQWQRKRDLRLVLEEAFNVEAVTKRFFEQYHEVFTRVQGLVEGFPETDDGREDKKLFVQTLFNRLMFIYFLSRKSWLKFKGDPDYLATLWKDYQEGKDANNFYEERLKPLFFNGLNNPRSADLIKENPHLHVLIGDVPFLNGGLFTKEDHDERSDIAIHDEVFSAILYDLFDHYNFTVAESTPLDQEVAVDPEMLGKVFEELVTGRHESGSYYTPRPVVSFMCREALKGYLQREVGTLSKNAIERFVDEQDVSELSLSSAEAVREALAGIKVVDPACGSGAYLLGMMHELVELETALYSEKLIMDPKSLYDLKLRIIEQNVYGADIDQFAVNVAMLRLWLSLAIDYESFPPPPLPNLDFKIVCGDSLTAPNPNPSGSNSQYEMFLEQARRVSGRLAKLKHQHITAWDADKRQLYDEIEEEMANLRAALAFSPAPDDALDWRVTFSEIFDQNEGFDVVVANPPYVTATLEPKTRSILRSLYSDTVSGKINTYRAFLHRGIQVAKEGGWIVYITPSTWLTAKQSTALRQYIKNNVQVCYIGVCPESAAIFERVTQEVAISVMYRSAKKTKDIDWNVRIVDPVSTISDIGDRTAERVVKWSTLTSTREGRLITGLDSSGLDLMLKLEQLPMASSIANFFQGEVNLTTYGDYISNIKETSSHNVLVRGNDLEPFWARLDGANSKGGWVLPSAISRTHWKQRRIATQEVSNMLQRPRLFSAPLEPGYLCAHTVDYCLVAPNLFDLMLAVLNSWVADFVFRIRSRTNHISVGELEELPLPPLTAWKTENMGRVTSLVAELAERRVSRPKINSDPIFISFQIAMMEIYGISTSEQEFLTSIYRD